MDKIAKKILHIFKDNQIDAYLVGGYVRDVCLYRTTFDIDIAVKAPLSKIKPLLIPFSPVQKFHSLFFTIPPYHFTITPLRIEKNYTEKRKPLIVRETTSVYEDSKRRDFRINALYQKEDGSILDFYDGLKDLKNKTIRCIGDPIKKLEEDPLRLLRALRFASILNFQIEEDLEKAILKCRPLLKNLSYMRKREELEKIYRGNPSMGFMLLNKYHINTYLDVQEPLMYPPSFIGLLPQLGDDYLFTKKEKQSRKRMIYYINKEKITDMDLLQAPLEEWESICFLKGISFISLQKRYNNLPITSLEQLNFPYDFFKDFSSISIQKEKILSLVLERKISNDKEVIRQYLTDNSTK